MKAGKVWGETRALLVTPMLEVHDLLIVPHAYCSLHRHRARCNAFVVTRGRLWIDVRQDDYALTDATELGVGELAVVPPGLWHRFRSGEEGAACLELYYPPALAGADIERRDVGGQGKAPTWLP